MIKNRSSRQGFTMMELLVVMTIISILTSLCVLGFKSLTGSIGLTGASDQFTSFLAFARQRAIARNTMVATVILTSGTYDKAAYRTYSAWELALPSDGTAPSSSNWVQTSPWKTLPPGVVVDSTATASGFLNSPTVSPALPTLDYMGKSLNPKTECAVQLFLPSGRLNPPPTDPCNLRLVEGFYAGSTLTYQHPSPANSALPANYVSYIFSTATGEPKIVRP